MKILQIVCIESVCGDTCVCTYGVRGQLLEVGSLLLPLCRFLGLNAGGEACVASASPNLASTWWGILNAVNLFILQVPAQAGPLSQDEIRRVPTNAHRE